ncbi:MAG: DUF6036 family nucleotidyltransferase [Gammaproteobacteria bacterium]
MRSESNAEKIRRLMEFLGHRAKGPGRIYLTGGATAVLLGWRNTTIDVDLKLDPEPPGVFDALREAKELLDINIEMAAPDDFVPALPGWRERSRSIPSFGPIEFRHYDFYGQALAKIERGHKQDIADVQSMFARQLIEPDALMGLYRQVEASLTRYPAIDPATLSARLRDALPRSRQSTPKGVSNG